MPAALKVSPMNVRVTPALVPLRGCQRQCGRWRHDRRYSTGAVGFVSDAVKQAVTEDCYRLSADQGRLGKQ